MAEVKRKAATTAKRKKKAGGVKTAPVSEKPVVKKDTSEAPKIEVKKSKPVPDTSGNLPDKIKERKILLKEPGVARVSSVGLNEIKATTKAIYVDDIHHANPTTLQTIHWAILKDHTIVIARLEEKEYNQILAERPRIKHLVSVVDCSVVPTLSYGSWTVDQLKGGFPSPQQIKQADNEFKNNPTVVHNPPVKIELYKEEPAEDAPEEELILLVDDEPETESDEDEDEGEEWLV